MLCVMKRMVFFVVAPQIEKLFLKQFPGLLVDSAERLIHQDDLGISASARANPTRCRMPPLSSWG